MTGLAETDAFATPARRPNVRIRPASDARLELKELWAYRELLGFFVWRDIKVRYKQTAVGVGWAVIQPLTTMVIFTVIFGNLAGIKAPNGVPYALFTYCGLLPWMYFASCLSGSSGSLVSSASLLSKVYFPRFVIPLAASIVPLVDFLVSFFVLLGLFGYYGRMPSWHMIALPVFLLIALLAALGVGLWMSVLNVRYRDIRYALPFVVQIWMYVSPVVYPTTLVPERWRWLLALNPMVGVIDGCQWSMLGTGFSGWTVLGVGVAMSALFLAGGFRFFRRAERTFADVI